MFELSSPKRKLGAAITALVIGGSIMLPQPGRTQAQAKDVLVANTASQPVPVAVQGTPTVSLSSSAPIPTYDARDAMEPFQGYLAGYGGSVNVPEGKRLVIEHVGLYAQCRGGVAYGPAIRTSIGGRLMAHQLSFDYGTYVPAPGSNNNRYEGSKAVRIYADPGTRVDFLFSTEGGSDSYGAASLSGYLVPAP